MTRDPRAAHRVHSGSDSGAAECRARRLRYEKQMTPSPKAPSPGTTTPGRQLRRRASVTVPETAVGCPLLVYLAERFTYHTVDEWRERIASGQVLVDGRRPDPAFRLAGGERLEYRPIDLQEPPVDRRFRIVHEDDAILVVDKPGDLPVHPGGRFFRNTLWGLLHEAGYDRFEFINRLDRETSGLVLLARTPEAARHCRRQIERRNVSKVYLAVVEGVFADEVRAEGWMTRAHAGPIRKKQRFVAEAPPEAALAPDRPRPALTLFEPVHCAAGLSLVRARPVTGRLHQIRATLEALGFPVVGDKLYGVDETLFLRFIEGGLGREELARLRLARQALHAAELALLHPATGRRVRFTAPLPPDMNALIKEAGLADPAGP